VIRLLTTDDADEVAALYAANREFLAPFEPVRDDAFFTVEAQRDRLERPHDANWWRWAILDDGAVAGMIVLNDVMRGALQMGSVGYWVDEARCGRGLATAALAAVVDISFGDLGLHRLEAGTLPDNVPSQRVLEKNGFERFGYAKQLLLIAGEWRDHVLYERVKA
jgi:[ribosomal protein S5]-alanine N-acetyltransferase